MGRRHLWSNDVPPVQGSAGFSRTRDSSTRAGYGRSVTKGRKTAERTSAQHLGIDGLRVGHWTDAKAQTGCSVIEFPANTTGSYEARGGAPASRDLELLHPDKTVATIDAVLLTGGSAFGLAAADGVMRYYEEIGRGVVTPAGAVPIVPTLALFDLAVGDSKTRPGPDEGYKAAQATTGKQVLNGRVGAGAGAYVGHWRGPDGHRPAGLASHVATHGDLTVAALCVVNAFGDINYGDGPIAGDTDRQLLQRLSQALPRDEDLIPTESRSHTTIGVVCTNAKLDKVGCQTVAQGAHDGLARSTNPPHTRLDGDAFIAAATGSVEANVDLVRYLALTAVTHAIRSIPTDRSVI